GEHVLAHGELAEDARLLREIAEPETGPAVHRLRRDVAAVERDAALVGTQQPHDHVERRALAGAVGPQEPHHLATAHVERHALHHTPLAVVTHQALGHEAVGG